MYSKLLLLESIITAVAFKRVPSETPIEGDTVVIVKFNCSSSSSMLSFIIGIIMFAVVSPALNVTTNGASS